MRQASRLVLIFIIALTIILSIPATIDAQEGNQAALVVRHSENDVRSICVDFDEPHISGYELLQRSGSDLQIGAQGIGTLICSIDNSGCPASDCLCQCKGGGDCIYWSYWHRTDDRWQYSQGGASVFMVEPGSVEGWSWGPGAVNQAVPPLDISFEEVCDAESSGLSGDSLAKNDNIPAVQRSINSNSPIGETARSQFERFGAFLIVVGLGGLLWIVTLRRRQNT